MPFTLTSIPFLPTISSFLISYPLFLLHFPPPHHSRILLHSSSCPQSFFPFNYLAIHACLFSSNPHLSLPFLILLLTFYFRFLALAAGNHFSPAVSRLVDRLRLSPSMAGVTLLAMGNGAPDAFSSAAALRGGLPRAGLAAILSAGAFVSAFVVGAVIIQSAPFSLEPAPLVRDIFFYIISVSALFYVYLSAEIFVWQAVGFILFYVFFVGFVFYMDYLAVDEKREKVIELEMGIVEREEESRVVSDEKGTNNSSLIGLLNKITEIWDLPTNIFLKLTIPSKLPSKSNTKLYTSCNIALCPILILYSLSSVIPINTPIIFLIPQTRFPLWTVILFLSLLFAISHYFLDKNTLEEEREKEECIAVTLISFMMSVFWVSTMAGELLNCLSAIGTIMNLPPAILGLTILAWGNSIGDLVADVALARSGKAEIAIAGCFAGPIFNMLVGLGTGLVLQSARVYPNAYKLQFNVNIVFAFVFLLVSLMGTLLVVTWNRFRVPSFWGFCLVGLYFGFTVVSLVLSRFSE
ncbi:hypothetical protein LUZ60_015589 [Juncus effusus]|nr:hypothetical protein LUZ60_015589 [Juncus effusus]